MTWGYPDLLMRRLTFGVRSVTIIAILTATVTAAAKSQDLTQTLPADAVVAWIVTPDLRATADNPGGSSLGLAAMLADQAQSLGLLRQVDVTTRAWIDSLSAASVLLHYPHAVALFDIQAKRTESGGHKLAGLSAALIVDVSEGRERIEERIQHLLSVYTNTAETALSQMESNGSVIYSLRDRRLPDWCILQWGQVGTHYIVSVGESTFDHVAATLRGHASSLARDDWFATAHESTNADQSLLTLYARFDAIDFSADSQLARKVGTVRRAASFTDVDRGLWTVAFQGRSLHAQEYLRRNGRNDSRRLTMPSVPGIELDKLIPKGATGYAIFDTTPAASLRASCEVYLATRSDESQAKTRAYWRDLEQTSGVDIQEDIVAHLAPGAVLHNYPPHILKLPLAWTFVARVDDTNCKDPEQLTARIAGVQTKIDALCDAWKDQLEKTGSVRLRNESDGLWFLDIGLPGPAVGMRGPWIVLSYSPYAVRENLRLLVGPPPAPGQPNANPSSPAARGE